MVILESSTCKAHNLACCFPVVSNFIVKKLWTKSMKLGTANKLCDPLRGGGGQGGTKILQKAIT